MSTWIWNGTEFERADVVPVSDRGFRYGMSVFESIRVANGSPQFLDAHLHRLRAACFDRDFPVAEEALDRSRHLFGADLASGWARIYVTAGDGSPTAPVSTCRIILMIEPRERSLQPAFKLGFASDICHPPFGGLKTGNYWANIDHLQRAQQRGLDEALLFNERAELVSACFANVFLVHGGRIRTPSTHCGARDGVVREWVMQQRAVESVSLFIGDVHAADEIFLTSSWIGVMPVKSLNGTVMCAQTVAAELSRALA